MPKSISKFAVVALFSMALSTLLMGADTWTNTQTFSVKAACTVGNEGIAGPTSATAGLSLENQGHPLKGFSVTVEVPIAVDAGVGNLIPAGQYMRAWVFNPEGKAPDGGVGGWWSRAPDLDLGPTIGGKLSESWAGFRVTAPIGRIAYLPNSLGGPGVVYMNGSP